MKLGASSRQRISRFSAVAVSTETRGNFAEHADGGDIGGVLLQMLAQQCLGGSNAALAQMCRRFHQPRIANGMLDVLRVSGVGPFGVADGGEVIPQRTPRRRRVGLQLDRTPQLRDGRFALPHGTEHEASS